MLDSAADMMGEMVPEAKAQSGSRLKARWYVGDDGSRQFLDWQDTELNTACSFTTGADGTLRCMPIGGAAGAYYFSNATCSTRLISVPQAQCTQGSQPEFGIYTETTCGASKYHIFPVTGVVQPANIYTGSPAACTPLAALAGYTFYSAGVELPASRFVAANVTVDN